MEKNQNVDIMLYDNTFKAKSVIDIYESLVWTDAYCGYGDFEIKIKSETAKQYGIDIDDYMINKSSRQVMIVEKMDESYDSDNSVIITYSGRSLESLLCRRVLRKEDVPKIVPQYNDETGIFDPAVKSTLVEALHYVLRRTIVQTDSSVTDQTERTQNFRGINNLGFEMPVDSTILEAAAPYIEVDGTTVYDYVCGMLLYHGYGFEIVFNPGLSPSGQPENNRQMMIRIYKGKIRTHNNKNGNTPVIFSPDDDTTFKMDATIDMTSYANTGLIIGPHRYIRSYVTVDEEGNEQWELIQTGQRYTGEVYNDIGGINRFETFIDCTNIESTDDSKIQVYPDSYVQSMMTTEATKQVKQLSSGSIQYNPSIDFDPYKVYGEDYYLGDIVTAIDSFNNISIVRISSFSHSLDSGGFKSYPNFETLFSYGGLRALEHLNQSDENIYREIEESTAQNRIIRVTESNNIDIQEISE